MPQEMCACHWQGLHSLSGVQNVGNNSLRRRIRGSYSVWLAGSQFKTLPSKVREELYSPLQVHSLHASWLQWDKIQTPKRAISISVCMMVWSTEPRRIPANWDYIYVSSGELFHWWKLSKGIKMRKQHFCCIQIVPEIWKIAFKKVNI